MGDAALVVLDRRVGATPVAIVIGDRAVGLLDRDWIVQHGQMVWLSRRQNLLERRRQLFGVFRRLLARPGVKRLHHRLA